MVEFALLAPVFVFLIMGIVDYGVAARNRAALDAAARTGLQVLIADYNDEAEAEASAAVVAPDADVDVSVACVCSDGAVVDCASGTCASGVPRRIATVIVTQDHTLVFPWPGIADPLQLTATAVGRAQ